MNGKYQVIHLTDGGEEYLMLREFLNNNYFDNNSTPGDDRDNVTGSFDLGWGCSWSGLERAILKL